MVKKYTEIDERTKFRDALGYRPRAHSQDQEAEPVAYQVESILNTLIDTFKEHDKEIDGSTRKAALQMGFRLNKALEAYDKKALHLAGTRQQFAAEVIHIMYEYKSAVETKPGIFRQLLSEMANFIKKWTTLSTNKDILAKTMFGSSGQYKTAADDLREAAKQEVMPGEGAMKALDRALPEVTADDVLDQHEKDSTTYKRP
ncbi:hypothetical protein [Legionella waltersii]|uniref:Uncharacterized protein n=1 Tax=Legionella waltersii TaxID=66969 RepID=A0A0W1ADG9_9GAMM|nr:hypothetical protein [Legionella waltersii]KTD79216.1 hypothetical protein Lwal_1288 [Legionella waltersii]SNV12566.1 Uncharacterised protein [Legionella waltersii]